jgi:FkbM family methyltransferase
MAIPELIYTVLLKPPPLRRAANAVIKLLLPRNVTVGNALIWINPNDPVISGALRFGVYEPEEIAFFRAHLAGRMTFIDVGANVGLYTGIALSNRDFHGTVLALEPDEESRHYLRQTVESNIASNRQASVIVCDLAASDHQGTLTLYKNPQNKGDNRIYPDPLLHEARVVPTDTLDNITRSHGIESVQFLKIDVQGAEALVIGGAQRLLRNSANCVLMTEFWPYGLGSAGSDALGYLDLLRQLGFALHELRRNGTEMARLDDPRALISRTRGRHYVNLVGLKGEFARHHA